MGEGGIVGEIARTLLGAPCRPVRAVLFDKTARVNWSLVWHSWVVLTEANVFAWPGPDLSLIHGRGPDGVAYGMLPPKLLQVIKARFIEHMRGGAVVKRSE